MALSYRSSSAANGGSATVSTLTPTLPTGWAANDLVYFVISIGANFTSPVDPSGWTVRYDTNSDSTGRTILAYRTMQAGDSAPAFSWTGTGKWAYTGICVQPASGQVASHSGLATPTINATGTSHTSPAFAAGALTGISVLLSGYRGGANAATAITTTPPTNWTEPASNADTSTAVGTTTALRQVAAWHSYQTGQTGTITPGAQTVSATAVANLYHVFAVETAPPGPGFSSVTAGAASLVTTGADPATTPGLPAGLAAGDLMVIHDAVVNQAGTVNQPNTPTGWTLKDSFGATGALGGMRHTWFYRWWQSGDTAPTVTLTGVTGTQHRTIIYKISGTSVVTGADPTDVLGAQTAPTASATELGPITGVTTTATGGVLLIGATRENDLTDASTVTLSTQSGITFTLLDTYGTGVGDNMCQFLAYALLSSGTAVTDKTFTISAGAVQNGIGQMWALTPGAVAAQAQPFAVNVINQAALIRANSW